MDRQMYMYIIVETSVLVQQNKKFNDAYTPTYIQLKQGKHFPVEIKILIF